MENTLFTEGTVGVAFLFAHGVLEFSPLPELASHLGRLLVLSAETLWLAWVNRSRIDQLLQCGRRWLSHR